ncbi:MAG: glycosyltransferase [Candidatus Omnitrophota bacterium]
MKILHIISKFDSYDAVAGSIDLTKYLLSKGEESIIASSLESQVLEKRKSDFHHYRIPSFEGNIRDCFVAYRKLKEIIKANKIDIVHTHSSLSSWLGFLTSRHTEIPLVTNFYDFFHKNLANYALTLGKNIIVHNESIGKYLMNDFNLPRDRIRFIRQSIDLDNFNFQDIDYRSKTDFKIGIISPLTHKEYENFLKAMVKVVRVIPYIKIYLISYKQGIKQNTKDEINLWIRRLGLTNYVKFLDNSNLDFAFISDLNLLILSAVKEIGSLRVLIESQAFGVPVIACRIAGIAELISDKETGILVSPQDNDALANEVTRLLRDFSLSRKIATNARQKIEREFSLEMNINKFIGLYKETIDNKRIMAINFGSSHDVISSIPALRLLKEEIPNTAITSVVNLSLRCLLKNCPYIDEFIVCDEKLYRGFRGLVRIVKLLIEKRFDWSFDFSNSYKTHLLCYLSLANKRYGYHLFPKFLANYSISKPSKSKGFIQDKIAIFSPLGVNIKDYKLELWPSQDDMDFAENFFKNNWVGKERLVGIDISVKKEPLNDYKLLDYFSFLCDKLANQQARVVLVSLKENVNIKNEITKRTKSKPILAIGDISAMQLACLIKKCSIYISLNPESLYMAMAMKTPSLILSKANNGFEHSKYKNIELITPKELNSSISNRINRRNLHHAEHRDKVIEKINKLMNAQ